MAPAPVVHHLRPSYAEALGDLVRPDEVMDGDAACHVPIVGRTFSAVRVAYVRTHLYSASQRTNVRSQENTMNNENNIDQPGDSEGLTVPSTPPVPNRSQRRSKWAALFDECRERPGVWRRTVEHFRPTTAAQIASDIRNAWRRDPKKMRLRGLLEGERWEAVWGPAPEAADPEQCYIWLRYLSDGAGTENDPGEVLTAGETAAETEYAW
jgi:hypothetical protein